MPYHTKMLCKLYMSRRSTLYRRFLTWMLTKSTVTGPAQRAQSVLVIWRIPTTTRCSWRPTTTFPFYPPPSRLLPWMTVGLTSNVATRTTAGFLQARTIILADHSSQSRPNWRPNGTHIGGCCVELYSFQNLNETFETPNIRNFEISVIWFHPGIGTHRFPITGLSLYEQMFKWSFCRRLECWTVGFGLQGRKCWI